MSENGELKLFDRVEDFKMGNAIAAIENSICPLMDMLAL